MPDGSWREPTRSLHLRWGTYIGRYLGGLTLIASGGVALQGANPQVLQLLLAGTFIHSLGWGIMPAGGLRRLWVVAPCVAAIWLLLSGPQWVGTLVITYIAWLIVRHRPLRSYITVIPVVANGILVPQFFHEYSQMPLALGISVGVLVASAWIARWIAATGATSSKLSAAIG